MELMERRRVIMDSPHIGKAEGDIVTTKHALAKPLKKCETDIELVQDLHGQEYPYPPGVGINIWNEEWELGTITTSTGEDVDSTSRIRSIGYIPVVPGETYYIKASNTLGLRYYDASKNFVRYDTAINTIRTIPSGCYFMRFTQVNTTVYNHDISINYPSTDTKYHPYSNICPISGWNGLKLTQTGKNLFDKAHATKYERAFSGWKWIPYAGAASYICKCKPNSDYVVTSLNENLTFHRIACIHENLPIPDTGNIALYNGCLATTQGSLNIHTDSEATYIVIQVNGSMADQTLIQVEEGTTASPYEQFGNLYEVTFPVQGKNLCSPLTKGIFINATTGAQETNTKGAVTDYIPVNFSNGSYYLSGLVDTLLSFVGAYNENKQFLGSTTGALRTSIALTKNGFKGGTAQGTGEIKYLRITQYVSSSSSETIDAIDNAQFQLEAGNSATSYEPYDNTVYGGTLDLLTGVLKVTHKRRTLTASDIKSFGVTSAGIPYMSFNSPSNIAGVNTIVLVCDKYKQSFSGQNDFSIRRSGDIYIYDSRITNQQEADQLLGTVEFVYNAGNPLTYQLTPQQITALKGINNIWADTGKTRIAYWTH